jgi:hypothetical protein
MILMKTTTSTNPPSIFKSRMVRLRAPRNLSQKQIKNLESMDMLNDEMLVRMKNQMMIQKFLKLPICYSHKSGELKSSEI